MKWWQRKKSWKKDISERKIMKKVRNNYICLEKKDEENMHKRGYFRRKIWKSLKCRYWERNNNEEKNHEITKCIQPGLDQCTGWI